MVANANFAQKLAEVRARAARLRCEAFVDYVPTVCGLTLNPVTLASYNRLLAFTNGFATGGPVTVEDIGVWIWVHHPDFGQRAVKAKKRVFRAVWRALNPRFPKLNALIILLSAFPRWSWLARFRVATQVDRRNEAIAHVRYLMREALYGFPISGGDEAEHRQDEEERERERQEEERATGVKIPRQNARFEAASSVAFQAQILNVFRREYGMPYAETEAIPLKKLSQLWREHLWSHAPDLTGLKLMDREEAALWAEQMKPEETARG